MPTQFHTKGAVFTQKIYLKIYLFVLVLPQYKLYIRIENSNKLYALLLCCLSLRKNSLGKK